MIAERSTDIVLAAHPDDEVLGAGGTIARHADAVDVVQVLIVAEGATPRQQQRDRDEAANLLSSLAKAVQAAGGFLGAADVELLSLLDNRLDSPDRLGLIKQIEQSIALNKLQVVYASCRRYELRLADSPWLYARLLNALEHLVRCRKTQVDSNPEVTFLLPHLA